ncbi:NAD(P)-dependent alcohol dehydrogenase [Occallatibacter savannae]|uniref:NAD(P)-dependent alcohol dehydrogenase n=1 Tax=Occallatibacter savannae TaxID=1002691 RepID=UPI000D698F7D|nr:NAD(P)-dependent alcohol dehydrogenase [Occallatibacter savannae]
MPQSKGFAATDPKTPLAPYSFSRREPGPTELAIDILFCGVCHSDLHMARNEWGQSIYPMVPGHEIVGRVTAAGKEVKKFKAGDIAAVGVIVDSCRHCAPCDRGEEHYCLEGATLTYAAKDRVDGSITMGGYSSNHVVDERFAHTVPANLDLAAVAPLLCAGITTYSPLRHWNVGPGKKVGIVGLGGLGHMGLKFAHSFGAQTIQFTTSLKKKDDAIKLGADEVIVSTDEAQMKKHAGTFDFILDTASAPHALEPYLSLLKQDGTLALVGLPDQPPSVSVFSLITKRASIAGSMIGGMPETQEMLDYCGKNNITADVEVIPIQQINEAFERMLKQDVKYRFVIEMSTLK